MTTWDDLIRPAPVYCDGCGQLIAHGEPTQTEQLLTPLGRCLRKTHVRPECVQASREKVDASGPVTVRATAQDRVNARARGRS
jgi:hypothetical protein